MHKFRVSDPNGVYQSVIVEVPFNPDPTVDSQLVCMAKFFTIKSLATEKMYGCPISEVDPTNVLEMITTLEYEKIE